MRVVLSANIFHYVHAAQALYEAGFLQQYICAIGTRGPQRAPWHWLPAYWRQKLAGRDLSTIPAALTHPLWLPEILQKSAIRSGLVSPERANWLHNGLYDRLARRVARPADILHMVSSIGLLTARRAKASGSLVICDIRSEHPDYQRRLLAEENQRLGLDYQEPGLTYDDRIKQEYALADYFIVPSNYARHTFIAEGFDPDRIYVVPYGVELDLFQGITDEVTEKADTSTGEVFRIIFAGQLIPRKGIHYLLEAFAGLPFRDAELLLLGRVDKSLQPTIDKAQGQDRRIQVRGNVPRVALKHYFDTGAVFVLPSLADSWGLVTAEAMACGLPAIVTTNTGSQVLVSDGDNGYVIPIRDSEALRHRLCLLYSNSALRTVMGRKARQTVQRFSWKNYQQRLIETYRSIGQRAGIPV